MIERHDLRQTNRDAVGASDARVPLSGTPSSGAGAQIEVCGADRPMQAYETWDGCDLYDRAREMQIEGYAFMTKTELINALRVV